MWTTLMKMQENMFALHISHTFLVKTENFI